MKNKILKFSKAHARSLAFFVGIGASSLASAAEGDPIYQPLLDALTFDSVSGVMIAGGAAVIGFQLAKGAIMGLVGMIRGAAR
jgi:cell division GTPase FtsZ